MFSATLARAARRVVNMGAVGAFEPLQRVRLFYPATALAYDASYVLTSRDAPHYDVPGRIKGVLDMALARPHLFDCVPVSPSVQPGGSYEQCAEIEAALRVHSADMVEFLLRVPKEPPVVPETFLIPGAFSRTGRVPKFPNLPQYAGAYCFDSWTPLTNQTIPAVIESLACALQAARAVVSAPVSQQPNVAYALCRTPGHHAGHSAYGGYCYLNNAVITARHLQLSGLSNVIIVDLDFHYGNGTHILCQGLDDVHMVSVHADPAVGYEPYFSGMAVLEEESGVDGQGIPKCLNLVYDPITIRQQHFTTLMEQACDFVHRVYDAKKGDTGALVVSLGVDALEDDPLHKSGTGWKADWYGQAARRLREVNGDRPMVVVHEGGYSPDKSPSAVLAFFEGLLAP
eukprot:comp24038_c1_seq1/m.43043 comp24038_c1_seq1/g.43043  ORF comp24038_c1_seq1/g.43043 comp24038_c1_seq1/m.43043 type:complete len:400 (-) comp24038_c1_seq1:49-1248(-)